MTRQRNQGLDKQPENNPDTRSEEQRDSPKLAHLLDAIEQRQDIGHFGRLTVAIACLMLSLRSSNSNPLLIDSARTARTIVPAQILS
jgi:hypothetical protein